VLALLKFFKFPLLGIFTPLKLFTVFALLFEVAFCWHDKDALARVLIGVSIGAVIAMVSYLERWTFK
jgi:hypothetical protein